MTFKQHIFDKVFSSGLRRPKVKVSLILYTLFLILSTTLLSCSLVNEDILNEGTNNNNGINQDQYQENQSSLSISLNVTMAEDSGTRSSSSDYDDELDREDGQSWENTVRTIHVILADPTSEEIITVIPFNSNEITTTNNTTYTGKTELEYEDAKTWLCDVNGNYKTSIDAMLYVVCNAPEEIINAIKGSTTGVQQKITVSTLSGILTYGGFTDANGSYPFLMSNADYQNSTEDGNKNTEKDKYRKTIVVSDLLASTDIDHPYSLNPTSATSPSVPDAIPVQRALARVDLKKNLDTFFFDVEGNYLGNLSNGSESDDADEPNTEGAPENWKTSIYLEYAGLINVNKNFNLFKASGNDLTVSKKNTDWGYFWSEIDYKNITDNQVTDMGYRYVLDPEYSNKVGLISSQSNSAYYMNSIFDAGMFRTLTNYTGTNPNTSVFSNYRTLQSPTGTVNGEGAEDHSSDYKIWKYAVPNTIHQAAYQKAAISTGIVFIGRLNFNGGLNEGTRRQDQDQCPIYAYKGKFYGVNRAFVQEALYEHHTSAKDQAMHQAYLKVLADCGEENAKWVNGDIEYPADLTGLCENHSNSDDAYKIYRALPSDAFAAALVANGFSIYIPYKAKEGNDHKKEYLCYYYCWIRHNDNGIEGEMGPMEFGVVRNNIYQISVRSVTHVGHPLPDPEIPTDPEPPTPEEDDEIFERYFSIDCKIKPWHLRRDDIDFF